MLARVCVCCVLAAHVPFLMPLLQGMVKKIVDDLLEEEYDDMYYSMRTKDDLDLYKKANWQRAVNLVLGMLMQGGNRSKVRT